MPAPVETVSEALPVIQWQEAGTVPVPNPRTGLPIHMKLHTRWNPFEQRFEAAICMAVLVEGSTRIKASQAAVDYVRQLFHPRKALARLKGDR